MRHILVSASVLLIAISTYGQSDSPPQPCTLKLSQAPAVRGVKLGMTVDELLPLFPGSSDSLGIKNVLSAAEGFPRFGDTTFSISPSSWGNKEWFAGISSYFFHTFDRRIIALTVQYDGFPSGARWKSADDLIQKFSDSLHLPGPKEWAPDPNNPYNPIKKLKCDGFEVTVSAGDQGSIYFYTGGWEGTKRERLAAFEEQKRREFKP
jgi:hypothetical protein